MYYKAKIRHKDQFNLVLLILANDDCKIFSVIFTSLFCMQTKTMHQKAQYAI